MKINLKTVIILSALSVSAILFNGCSTLKGPGKVQEIVPYSIELYSNGEIVNAWVAMWEPTETADGYSFYNIENGDLVNVPKDCRITKLEHGK